VPIAATPDQLPLQASVRDWAKQAAPLAAVRRPEPGLPAGQATTAVALTASPLTGTRQPDGSLRVTGQSGPILGAGTQVGERVLGLPR
jgi:hypothetical protein